MAKVSFWLSIVFLSVGLMLFKTLDLSLIFAFLIYDIYLIITFVSILYISKELFIKAIALYLSIFWGINFITDCFMLDGFDIIALMGSLFIYPITAKKVILNRKAPLLSFKNDYIFHLNPDRWYQWLWLLVGKDLNAGKYYYNPEHKEYFRVVDEILEVKTVDYALIQREVISLGCDVSIAEVSYEEMRAKVGKKTNCIKEIY